MRKRRMLLLLISAVALAVILFATLKPSDEPKYQGRTLSFWLEQYEDAKEGSGESLEAQNAVRAIGTNALPFLLRWFPYEPETWQRTLRKKLPISITNTKLADALLGIEDTRRASYSLRGIQILGANAASALPRLETWMKDTTNPRLSCQAFCAAVLIGESSIPVLQAGFADPNQTNRLSIIQWLCVLSKWHHQSTHLCVPLFVESLNDNDPAVRSAATNILRDIAPEVLTNAPAN